MKKIIHLGLIAGAVIASAAAQAQTAWADKITLGGDLRMRYNHQWTDNGGAGASSNDNQIRARISASAKVNEDMTANIRLATDQSTGGTALTNRSTNDTLGNNGLPGAHSELAVDLAYGDWRVMQGLVVSFGKAPNPFWSAGKNQMLWDADLAFDGFTAKWAADMGTLKPFANASYNWMANNSDAGTGTNQMQESVQVGVSSGIGSNMNGTLAIAYHNFSNAGSAPAIVAAGQNYELIDVGAELGTDMVHNLPLAVFGDWAQNNEAANTKQKTAWTAGVKAGALAAVHSWEAWYNYRDVDSLAVIGTIADSDFAGGAGADIKGHEVGAGYMAWDNTTVGLDYMTNTFKTSGTHYERVIADLVWKF